jgi:hypothetical protein
MCFDMGVQVELVCLLQALDKVEGYMYCRAVRQQPPMKCTSAIEAVATYLNLAMFVN